MTTDELIDQALLVRADLERLHEMIEHSASSPGVKSALSRDASESEIRVDDIVRRCRVLQGQAALAA